MLYSSTILSARTKAESQAVGDDDDKCVSFKVLLISSANYTHLLTHLCICFSLYVKSVEVEGYFDGSAFSTSLFIFNFCTQLVHEH